MEESEFAEVYRRWAPTVLGFCTFRTGDRHLAEDLTDETFIRLLERGTHIAREKRGAWLLAVARNLCIDLARRKREVPVTSLPDLPDPASGPAPEPAWLDERVKAAVADLPVRQAQVLFLRAVMDLSFAEVGRLTGRSEGSARVIYHRALKAVRHRLKDVGAWNPGMNETS